MERFIELGTFTVGRYKKIGVSYVADIDLDYIDWVIRSADELGLSEADLSLLNKERLRAEQGDDDDEYESEEDSFFTEPPPLPPPLPVAPVFQWTEEQQEALDRILQWAKGEGGGFYALTGPAGTGKSTLMREIAKLGGGYVPNRAAREHFDERLDYNDTVKVPAALAAMTGKAALRLAACAGRDASTTHSILYHRPASGPELKFTSVREPCANLVVIDEASMMTPTIFEHLKKWVEEGVKILLVGDSYQLPPVITGEEAKTVGDDYSVFSLVKGSELQTVMRNSGGVLRAATQVRETGEIVRQSDDGYEFFQCESSLKRAIDEYLADREDHLVITWRNVERMAANRIIRERLGHGGPLPDEGEPVLIKKNGQGHLNGEIVRCGGFESGPLMGKSMRTLWMRILGRPAYEKVLVSFEGGSREKGGEMMDGQRPYISDWREYQRELEYTPEPLEITWGYVLSCHAAQGSEARRVTVFLSRDDERSRYFRKTTTLPNGDKALFSSRFIYTALTRGKTRAMMLVGG